MDARSLSDRLAEHGIKLRSYTPGSHRTTCPACSHARRKKTDPCLAVEVDQDGEGATWFCQHCNEFSGNVPGTTYRRDRCSTSPRTVRKPAPPVEGKRTDRIYEAMERRAISHATVDALGIVETRHWFPQTGREEPCIAFPYRHHGEVVNHKYRTAKKQFAQDKDALQVLFNIDAVKGAKTVFWVEGEMDVLAMYEAGFHATVSLPDGAPAPRKDGSDPDPESMDRRFAALTNCLDDLAHVERFVLAGDTDGPGGVLMRETARRLGRERCYQVHWPDGNDVVCKDANETLLVHGAEVVRECIEAATPWPITGIHEARDFEQDFWRFTRGEIDRGLTTGWPRFDDLVRLRGGDLWVVTGIPNHGKTEFIDALMINAAREHGWRWGVASFENEPAHHIAKLAEKWLHMPVIAGPTSPAPDDDQRAAFDWVQDHFVFLRTGDHQAQTLDALIDMAKVLLRRYGISGLVIDPWNELEHQRPARMTETEYTSEALGKLRRFARANSVLIFLIAHPVKLKVLDNGKVPVPTLYDISGSAHFANKCDIGIAVFRDDDPIEGPVTDVHVRKVRHKWIGCKGNCRFSYNRTTGEYHAIGRTP